MSKLRLFLATTGAAASESVNADGVCAGTSIRWLGWLTEDADIGVIESNLLGEEDVP